MKKHVNSATLKHHKSLKQKHTKIKHTKIKHTKIKHIKYETLNMQGYMRSPLFTNEDVNLALS